MIRITHAHGKSVPSYTLAETCLESVDQVKDIGVTITKDLSWSQHVAIVISKANKVLGIIKQTAGPVDIQIFSMALQIACETYIGICRSTVVPLFSSPLPIIECYKTVFNINTLDFDI